MARLRPSLRRHRHPGQRGQALVETALVVLTVITLFVGVYACAVAISDAQQAGGASRSGARFAAQVGANGYKSGSVVKTGCQASATDPCIVDNQILQTVLGGLNNGKVNDAKNIVVTVYQPCSDLKSGSNCNGTNTDCALGTSGYTGGAAFNPTYDAGEVFTQQADGSFLMTTPKTTYDLSMRAQKHPHEAAVGVQVELDYTSPTPLIRVTAHLREFTINCLAPSS